MEAALFRLGPEFSSSRFYRAFYDLAASHSVSELTVLATRYRLIDFANSAILAHTYAQLRMGKRPLRDMTITDMAFIWSAYRGGVVDSDADLGVPSPLGYRWSLDELQKAQNTQVFGDTLLAVPYFTYFREVYHRAVPIAIAQNVTTP
jgi:hypothetical protein